jgi:hypothetical protein
MRHRVGIIWPALALMSFIGGVPDDSRGSVDVAIALALAQQACEPVCDGCVGSVFPVGGVSDLSMPDCSIRFVFSMQSGKCCGEPCAGQPCSMTVDTLVVQGGSCCPVVGFVVGGTLDVYWWQLGDAFSADVACFGPPLTLVPGGGISAGCESIGFGPAVYVDCSECPDVLR